MNKTYPKVLNTFGDYLRKKRLDSNLTQAQVAEIFYVHRELGTKH